MAVKLFTPLDVGGITLPNRVVISPMCQYSADDGSMNDWHFVHLGHLAYSGAGLMILEATHVTREGRITHGCSGLYSDHNEASIARVIANDSTKGFGNAEGFEALASLARGKLFGLPMPFVLLMVMS